MTAGDTHGNGGFIRQYLYPKAQRHHAEVIVQVGDFGFWEHTQEGVYFLDRVDQAAEQYGIPLYWLAGNHDKWSLAMARYGHDVTADGFVVVRPGVFFIPNGHIWQWGGVRMRAFGGAYSIDKASRLEAEARKYANAVRHENHRLAAGCDPKPIPTFAGTQWFPEEQMTDVEFAALLAADSSYMDVIFSHDRPRSADCGIPLKDEPECWPNQDNLQRALVTHKPKLWIHGHLHHNYLTHVRSGDDDFWTHVHGLAPDPTGAMRGWKPWQSWCLLDLRGNGLVRLTPGGAKVLDGVDV